MKLARVSALSATLIALGLGATGCNQPASGMAIMDTEASLIAPPESVTESDSFDSNSIRSLGEFDGQQYFVAKATETASYCLIAYDVSDQASSSGCGSGGGGRIVELGSATWLVALAVDGHDMSAGGKEPWVKLSENLWKRG